MKIPLTKYGMPQVLIFPLGIVAAMALVAVVAALTAFPVCAAWIIDAVLFIVLCWVFSFFRDPARKVPLDDNLLVSPADGKVTDIEVIEENDFIEGKALRIGIFLSVFNVHINRVPCKARIEKIVYKEGHFKNALDPESARVNEANDVFITKLTGNGEKMIIRQISGAIARKIVCATKVGDELEQGQQFGMIKFGSRTELILPYSEDFECIVKKGEKVRAGISELIRWK